ncbi:hypothetical protein PG985_005554 [Apiospora marii]|uniref:uncharacterized protein n=1 Tax=Apiospora marii TaxID=335849 RepID=UPI00312E8421
MKSTEVDQDIAAFVAQHLRENRRLRKWQRYYDRIEKALTDRANRVFRWVECQFTTLAACAANPHVLNQLLQSLPQSLDETYARMLKNIEPEMREYARQMLSVLCCAMRPLTDLELIDALAVELSENPRFDVERRFQDLNHLKLICPGFIEIDLDLDKRENTVRIAHFSVQEYLEDERILEREDVALFHVRKQGAHISMATVCLALLLEPQVKELQDTDSIEKAYPLAKYAARYWPQHIASRTLRSSTGRKVSQLFQDRDGAFSTWVHIWNVDHYSGRLEGREAPSPIYYAAVLGLTKILGELLNDGCSTTQVPVRSHGKHNLYIALTGLLSTAPASAGTASERKLMRDSFAVEIFRFTNAPTEALRQVEEELGQHLYQPNSQLFQDVESHFWIRLIAELQECVRTLKPLGSLGLFSAAVGRRNYGPWGGSSAHSMSSNAIGISTQESRAKRGIEDIAARLAHLGLLHWRVWSPLIYLGGDNGGDNGMELSQAVGI